jgi:prepilin-type N-terminal cleavage/methylation domain-containing protein
MIRARAIGFNEGFTLIEMLVAVGLMALMGVLCWRGLAFIADRRAAIEGEGAEIAQLMRTFAQIERDLAERLPDIAVPARATSAELPLAVSVTPGQDGRTELEILRVAPEGAMPSPAWRVLYRLDARGLVRKSGSGEVLMLPGAAQLHIRVHAGGFWLEPGGGEQRLRPFMRANALEIAVDDAQGARYLRVLAL